MTIDWNAPLEAYHVDGRVVAVTLKKGNHGYSGVVHRVTNEVPDPSESNENWYEDGLDWCTGSQWRIRNVGFTPEQEAVAFTKKMAALSGVGPLYSEARRIVALMEPEVDADLVVARELVAASLDDLGSVSHGWERMAKIRSGNWDNSPAVVKAVEALRRARNEGEIK